MMNLRINTSVGVGVLMRYLMKKGVKNVNFEDLWESFVNSEAWEIW